MRRALVAAGCALLTFACASPVPARAVASPTPASIRLSVLAGRSGVDLRVTLDQAL